MKKLLVILSSIFAVALCFFTALSGGQSKVSASTAVEPTVIDFTTLDVSSINIAQASQGDVLGCVAFNANGSTTQIKIESGKGLKFPSAGALSFVVPENATAMVEIAFINSGARNISFGVDGVNDGVYTMENYSTLSNVLIDNQSIQKDTWSVENLASARYKIVNTNNNSWVVSKIVITPDVKEESKDDKPTVDVPNDTATNWLQNVVNKAFAKVGMSNASMLPKAIVIVAAIIVIFKLFRK